jgi:ribosome-binding factor A
MRSTRMKRTDDLVRRVISEAILTKLSDPRIGFVSVTGVRVSPEFDTAQVYVSVLGDEKVRAETMRGLRSAASFLQSQLAREIRMRRTPRLRFLYDSSLDRGFRVDATLKEIHDREDGDDDADGGYGAGNIDDGGGGEGAGGGDDGGGGGDAGGR